MTLRQNSHLTFKQNIEAGRHGWLRLTPAYSYRLVHDALDGAKPGTRVLDPFSGSGTTGLVAAELGLTGRLVDVNPFLVWFGQAKTRNYDGCELVRTKEVAQTIADALGLDQSVDGTWFPPIHRIERWWSTPTLAVLGGIRAVLDNHFQGAESDDLLAVAFCRTIIGTSNAAFNHQSMSFKQTVSDDFRLFHLEEEPARTLSRFQQEVEAVVASASTALPGEVDVVLDDARYLKECKAESFDLLYSSPPYANRMSYIRELRPYMYWLRYLNDSRAAGELDWEAIGGTWGVATSRVGAWESDTALPLDGEFPATLDRIAASQAKNAPLLARYVHKYFYDMWLHFQSAARVVRRGGRAVYIVGNSTFYGHLVPTERWYANLLHAAGFSSTEVRPLRKRNSKRELFEYSVEAVR